MYEACKDEANSFSISINILAASFTDNACNQDYVIIEGTGGPRYMRSFYLRIRVSAIAN
jgi:hypothetical protein